MASLCDNCRASGLPILPVRYAVVPSAIAQGLPGWVSGERVASTPLDAEFKYALRTMRAGYIYLFYSKNQYGPNVWECYVVTADGQLSKQPAALMAADQPPDKIACASQGSNRSRFNHLVIERPDKCGPTWIAFSPHKWSEETLNEYTTNSKLRNARMQTIHPAEMAKGAKHSHGTPASEAALEQVMEYAAISPHWKLPYGGPASTFSTEDGGFRDDRLRAMSTLHPWNLRQGLAAQDVAAMQLRAKKADGSNNTPHILALWDALGIAHELNGFRNDAAGWLHLYSQERESQIAASSAYAGIEQALKQKVEQRMDDMAARGGQTDIQEVHMRDRAIRLYSKGSPDELGQPLAALDRAFKAGQVDEPTYRAQRSQIFAKHSTNPAAMETEYAKIDRHRRELAQTRSTTLAKLKTNTLAESWGNYSKKIDTTALAGFNAKWAQFQDQVDAIVDQRTLVLIQWLQAPLLIDTLEDFHATSIDDGVLFDDAIGEMTFGMGSSRSGAAKIDEWIVEARATVKSNLLWRAVALNQAQAMDEVDATLKEAEQHKGKRTLADALTIEGYLAKFLKAFADTYKKAASVYAANTKAASEKGSTAYGVKLQPVNMRGMDRWATTFGDRVFRHFAIDGPAERLSEKIIQNMFALRAFVSPADSVKLIVQQARHAQLSRAQTLERLRTARTFLAADSPAIKSAQTEQLKQAWSGFKSTHKDGLDAIRDARVAVVVMLIEGVNFQKLLAECALKNDAKSWWSLAASALTISSALFDVASTAAKGAFNSEVPKVPGGEAWSYQRLKLWGGLLSAAATSIGVGLDLVDAGKSFDKRQYKLVVLFGLKAFMGAGGAALTVATTFTYAAPLIERLTGRAAAGVAIRAISGVAAEVLATRILFMAAGTWITVGAFGIQCFIWIIADDKLQEWCELSAFGTNRSAPAAFKTSQQQQEMLQEAMIEVGLVQ